MAMNQRLVSSRFPYLPIHIQLRQRREDIEAFLDTGFDGHVAVPPEFIAHGQPPDGYLTWRLADGSEVLAPYYLGTVQLGQMGTLPAVITSLGDEPLIGRGIADRFTITLDHGQRVIVEP